MAVAQVPHTPMMTIARYTLDKLLDIYLCHLLGFINFTRKYSSRKVTQSLGIIMWESYIAASVADIFYDLNPINHLHYMLTNLLKIKSHFYPNT